MFTLDALHPRFYTLPLALLFFPFFTDQIMEKKRQSCSDMMTLMEFLWARWTRTDESRLTDS